jgi:hypothetical protein
LATDPIKARGRDGLEEAFEDPDRFDETLRRRGVEPIGPPLE